MRIERGRYRAEGHVWHGRLARSAHNNSHGHSHSMAVVTRCRLIVAGDQDALTFCEVRWKCAFTQLLGLEVLHDLASDARSERYGAGDAAPAAADPSSSSSGADPQALHDIATAFYTGLDTLPGCPVIAIRYLLLDPTQRSGYSASTTTGLKLGHRAITPATHTQAVVLLRLLVQACPTVLDDGLCGYLRRCGLDAAAAATALGSSGAGTSAGTSTGDSAGDSADDHRKLEREAYLAVLLHDCDRCSSTSTSTGTGFGPGGGTRGLSLPSISPRNTAFGNNAGAGAGALAGAGSGSGPTATSITRSSDTESVSDNNDGIASSAASDAASLPG